VGGGENAKERKERGKIIKTLGKKKERVDLGLKGSHVLGVRFFPEKVNNLSLGRNTYREMEVWFSRENNYQWLNIFLEEGPTVVNKETRWDP